MPTILRVGPYRFFFYGNERGEPAHIHVRHDRALAKFWLQPLTLARSRHFAAQELAAIRRHIEDHIKEIEEAWNVHHGG